MKKKYVPSERGSLTPVLGLSKKCKTCGKDRERSEFSRGRTACKTCRRADTTLSLERNIRMQNLRANRRGVEGKITAQEWLERVAYFGNRCAFCGSAGWAKTLEIGHIYPLSKHAANPDVTRHNIDSVIPLCHKCNCAMGDGSLLTFIGWYFQTLDGAA